MRAGSLSVMWNVNGRSTLRARVVTLSGTYSPAFDDIVLLEDAAAATMFAGYVTDVRKIWLGANTSSASTFETEITVSDYSAYTTRRLIAASSPAGTVARDAVDAIVAATLAPFGVTRDPGMAAGATLGALVYDFATVEAVFNDLIKLAAPAGWVWYIDNLKVLKAYLPSVGAAPCPWTMTDASSKIAGGDIEITKTRQDYANRVYLVYNNGTSTPANVTANDAAEQALYGLYETVIRSDGPFNATTAQAVVDAALVKFVTRPRTLVFRTDEPGARPGQTLTVNITNRAAGDFLITGVEMVDFGGAVLLYTITAVEGATFPGDWRDTVREWSGGGASSALVSSVTIITSTAPARVSYFLGGSGIAAEQSAGPSVLVAVGYIDVMIDTAALPAGTSCTAVVQCKTASAGAGVTPQVYNMTTAAVVGTGSLVVGTAWTTVTFAVTLAAGANTYRLRMTPDTAAVDCFTLGYLEVGR